MGYLPARIQDNHAGFEALLLKLTFCSGSNPTAICNSLLRNCFPLSTGSGSTMSVLQIRACTGNIFYRPLLPFFSDTFYGLWPKKPWKQTKNKQKTPQLPPSNNNNKNPTKNPTKPIYQTNKQRLNKTNKTNKKPTTTTTKNPTPTSLEQFKLIIGVALPGLPIHVWCHVY